MEKEYLSMLEATAARRLFEDTMVGDPGLCHGSAGIFMIYSELYRITGKETFNDACEFWLHYTICLLTENISDGAAECYPDKTEEQRKDFLDGISGVGIGLLSYNYFHNDRIDVRSKWKEALFLYDTSNVLTD